MATKVLRPQNLLFERCNWQQRSFYRRGNFPANLVGNRKQQRKASPKADKRKSNHGGVSDTRREHGGCGGVMGQARLLRRGESLSSVKTAAVTPDAPIREPVNDLAVSSTERVEPNLSKQIRRISAPPPDFYAGSVCYSSPSPQALPLPSFLTRKARGT